MVAQLRAACSIPQPGTDTAEKLEWPTSPEGRRGSMYPIAG
ncbi:hypothetical protein [Streptomyces erythrochromogenes]